MAVWMATNFFWGRSRPLWWLGLWQPRDFGTWKFRISMGFDTIEAWQVRRKTLPWLLGVFFLVEKQQQCNILCLGGGLTCFFLGGWIYQHLKAYEGGIFHHHLNFNLQIMFPIVFWLSDWLWIPPLFFALKASVSEVYKDAMHGPMVAMVCMVTRAWALIWWHLSY